MDICKYWYERDNDSGLYEYCKAANKKCDCSGDRRSCSFPEYLNTRDNSIGINNMAEYKGYKIEETESGTVKVIKNGINVYSADSVGDAKRYIDKHSDMNNSKPFINTCSNRRAIGKNMFGK